MRIEASLRGRQAFLLVVLIAAVACGDSGTDPSKTQIFTGVFPEFGYTNFFLANGRDADASLTWTVPAEGTRPTASLSFWVIGIPDRLQVQSSGSATPPVTLRGSGSYIMVACSNCQRIAPVSFTLTVVER